MIRTRPQSATSTEKPPETALVLSFTGSTDEQKRRVRYLASPGVETMWRVEERRRGADWQIVDAEPIEELQLNFSDSAPKPERHADITV